MQKSPAYLFNGLKMKSKNLQRTNALLLLDTISDVKNVDLNLKFVETLFSLDFHFDEFSLICLFFMTENTGAIKLAIGEGDFFKFLRRIINYTNTELEYQTYLGKTIQKVKHLPTTVNELLILTLCAICSIHDVQILIRMQAILKTLNIIPFCEIHIKRFPDLILHLVEFLNLECLEMQLTFTKNEMLMTDVIGFLNSKYFQNSLKALINISSGNVVAVESLTSRIDFNHLYEQMQTDSHKNIILGFLLNILEYQTIPISEADIENFINLYNSKSKIIQDDKSHLLLFELLFLWLVYHDVVAIDRFTNVFVIEDTLEGIHAMTQMQNRNWDSIHSLVNQINSILEK
eukprot:NODE_76_length_23837_cov_1.242396.p7 type:complete len:346 gc:universal NODE_76_length_23837_cov_1.242396:17559-18596(+)